MQPKVDSLEAGVRLQNHLEILFLKKNTAFTIRNKKETMVMATLEDEARKLHTRTPRAKPTRCEVPLRSPGLTVSL